MKFLISFMVVLVSYQTQALPNEVSAHRPPLVSWKVMEQEARARHGRIFGTVVIDQAQPLQNAKLERIPKWQSYVEVEENFRYVRDLRFIEESANYFRRSTWMFPDDGCYARAALMNKNIEDRQHVATPYKIFVFGDLNVYTKNALGGSVTWWFHVAPIVSDGKDVYVIDPAMNAQEPMKLYSWLQKMGQPSEMTISICEGGSYEPYSDCYGSHADYDEAMDDQRIFLDSERERLLDLGRDADKELGDFPPWLK